MTDEAASTNVIDTVYFPRTLKAIIKESGYSLQQIFNVDETEKRCLYECTFTMNRRLLRDSKFIFCLY